MIGAILSDRYEILSELGRGGMGVVYRARDPRLNREVAVKLIPPTMLTPEAKQRFEAEAQVVAGMDHPGIVPIYDFGSHEDSLFFVMPVVEGTSLRALLRERQLSLGDVLEIGIQVSEALDYSHARGIVHRDIKPENIMITHDTAGLRCRVMDFGLARSTDVTRMTKTGTLIGTMAYLSPEQVAGSGVDPRSDVYALGVVLYELVTNEVPFAGEMQSVLYRVVHELPQSPRERGAEIDEAFDQMIADCLAKEPESRPRGAADVARALRHYRSGLNDSDQLNSLLATRSMVLATPMRSPFVGRKEELKELQGRLNQALTGKCQLVAIGGDAGVGKTRLLEELESLARARQLRVLHGRFMEQGAAFPYFGFCEAIQEYFQQKDTGSSSSSGLPDLEDLAADLISLFPMLAELEPIRSAATGQSQLSQGVGTRSPESQAQIFELLARTLTRLAGGKPLVLLFEDLHGADASIEALQYVVRRLGPTPTLVIGTYRSNEIDRRHPLSRVLQAFRGDRQFVSLTMASLSPGEHREFLSTLVGGNEVQESFAGKLYETSEGNPFFTKELVRSLMDAGNIVQDDTGTWTLSGGTEISAEAMPATIQEAVEERIGRLPDDLRDVLSTAAVIGKTFEFKDLEELAGGGAGLDDAIDQLEHEGLVEEERQSRGDRLTFTSGVVREVLYAGLSRRRRRSLHRRFAQLLEQRHAGRLEGVYPQLVHHFAEGDDPDKTVLYGINYARRSLESFSPEEVIRAAKAALEYLDQEWEGERTLEGETRLLLARGREMSGDVAGALKEAEAAIRVFETENAADRALEALLAGARVAWHARRTEEGGRWVTRGIQAARAAGDAAKLREFLSMAATIANLRGEYARANEHLKEVETLEPAEPVAAPEEIPTGGTLVVPLANPVAATAPVDNQFVEENEVSANVCETLLATDEEGTLVPVLCDRWEAVDGGLAFRLTLRPEVRFHDGQALTADDVKACFEHGARTTSLDLPAALAAIDGAADFKEGSSPDIRGIVVHDRHTLELRLAEPLPIYMSLLTDPRTAICRFAEPTSDAGGAEPALVGTGPFRLASRTAERIDLRRAETTWHGEPARLDGIEFRTGLSATEIAAGFRAGEFDLGRDLLLEDLEDILRDPAYRDRLVERPRKYSYFVIANTRTGTMTNLGLRQALAGVVRPHEIVWRTLGRFAQPATCYLPPGILGHDPGRRHVGLSLDEAREAMEAAGVSGPLRLRAAVQPLLQDRYGALVESLFATWSEMGVDVEIATPDMDSFLGATENSDGVDLYIGRFGPDYDDPDNFTTTLFNSHFGFLRSWYCSAEADARLDEARATSSPEEREVLYRKFEDGLLQDGVVVPLFYDIDYRLAGPRVRGLRLTGSRPFVNYTTVGRAEAEARPAAAPRVSGVIQIPMAAHLTDIDPAASQLQEQGEVDSCVYETLTRAAGDGRIVPWLASGYEIEDSGRTIQFRLRPDIRFHDGRRFTARDVRFSFERLIRQSGPLRYTLLPVQGASAIVEGKTTALAGFRIQAADRFALHLDEPLAFFPAVLSFTGCSIVPEGTETVGSSWRDGAVGTGPFRVVSFQPGERIELERNPDYWREGRPASQGLVFSLGVPPSEILAGFQAGRFSIAGDLRPADVEVLRRDPEFAAGYREAPGLITYFVALNVRRGPLEDRELRRALTAGLDVPAIVRGALGRLAIPAHGLLPPGLLGHEALPGADFASLPPGGPRRPSRELELTAAIHPIYAGEYSTLFQKLGEALRELGVRVRTVAKTMDDFLQAEEDGSADLYFARWNADYADSDTFAFILHSGDGFLRRYCASPDVDRLIERGRTEVDPQARHAIYRRIETTVAEEALLLPLFHEQVYRFARPEVRDLEVSFVTPTVSYEKLKIQTRG